MWKETLILSRLGYFLLISFHEYVEHHKSIFNVKKDYSKVKKKIKFTQKFLRFQTPKKLYEHCTCVI